MEESQAVTEHVFLDLKEGSELGIYICDSIVEDPQDSSLILKVEIILRPLSQWSSHYLPEAKILPNIYPHQSRITVCAIDV